MATIHITSTDLNFTSDGTNINAGLSTTAPDILSLFSTSGAQNTVAIENIQSLELIATTSGNSFTQHAHASTTSSYAIIWPSAQATGTQVLENDGAGNLSWASVGTSSAGVLGDIQYSDGSGGFLASTTSIFNYTDGTTSTLDVGVNNGTFQVIGANGTTDAGTNIQVFAGDGGSGSVDGGSVSLSAGDQVAGTGNAGTIDLLAGSTTGTGSNVTIGGASVTGLGGTILLTGGNTPADATIGAQIFVRGGQAANGGSLDFTAGNGDAAGPGGNLNFTSGDGKAPGEYLFNPAGTTGGPALVTIQGVSEAATSSTTGTVQITDGLGVSGTVWADELTTDTSLNLNGTTSGTLSHEASATTTSYTLVWPDAQSTGTQILQNDGSGNLSWVDETDTQSAGNAGDVQYSDGSGGFVASTTARFNYTDGSTSTLGVGVASGLFVIDGVDGTTTSGAAIRLQSGDTSTGSNGGTISLICGHSTSGSGNGGQVLIVAGDHTGGTAGSGGSVYIAAGENFASGTAPAGDINLITKTGTTGGSILMSLADGNTSLGGGVSVSLGGSFGGSTKGSFQITSSASGASGFMFRLISPGGTVMQAQDAPQNATSVSTGSIRVPNSGGIGVTGTVFANELTSNTDININGATSGTFTQQASGTTTSYTITWPNAQGGSNQTLINNGSGGLSWSSAVLAAAGSAGDIQYNNGSGGLAAATNNFFRYTDGATDPVLLVGKQDDTFHLQAADATTTGDGGALAIQSGAGNDTGSGGLLTIEAGAGGLDGGNINITSGLEGDAGGTTGTITISTPDTSVGDESGSIIVRAGNASTGTQGNILLELTSGSTTPGQIVLQGAEAAGANVGFVFQDAASTPCVEILSGTENATTTTTGTVRITGGLGVSQDIFANTVNVTSDVHAKENIREFHHNVDYDNLIHHFLQLQVYQYTLRATGTPSLGILAQDLVKAFPNTTGLVTLDPQTKEPIAINYNGVLMILIATLQKLIRNFRRNPV